MATYTRVDTRTSDYAEFLEIAREHKLEIKKVDNETGGEDLIYNETGILIGHFSHNKQCYGGWFDFGTFV